MRVAGTVGIGAYILTGVDAGDLMRALTDVRPALVGGALAIYLLGQVLSAYKWSLLGRAVGFGSGFLRYARFYFIGMFVNLFGPSTIGGDLARGVSLGASGRRTLALDSVVFDRASGLALLMALGAAAQLAFRSYGLPWLLAGTVSVVGIGLLVGWWMCPRLVRLLPAHNRLRRHVEVDLALFWQDRRLLVRVAVLSLAFHLSQVCVQWVLARAAGAAVPFGYCLLYHPVISVMTALPVSIGGFGVREGGYLYFLTRIGIADSVALTVGLLWFMLTLLGGLVGGAIFAVSGAQLPEVVPRARDTIRPPAGSPPG